MTIGIGMIGKDCLVMATDTQESSGNYMKTDQQKLMTFCAHSSGTGTATLLQPGACIVAGAGDSGYVRALRAKMGMAFLDNPEVRLSKGLDENYIEPLFEGELQKFYSNHILPFAAYPSRDRPDVEMMIGAFRNHELRLYVTEKTALIGLNPYEAIGIGCTYAKLLLDRLWEPHLPAQELAALAAYIIFMTKESVENCGKYTTIATIYGSKVVVQDKSGPQVHPPHQSVTYTPWNHIDQWERNFRTTWATAEKRCVLNLLKDEAYGPTPEKFRKRRPNIR